MKHTVESMDNRVTLHHKLSLLNYRRMGMLVLLTAVLSLLLLPANSASSAPTVIYETDFETNDGWTTLSGTATTGLWEVGNPQQTADGGYIMQLTTTTSGSQALVTGASAGANAGANDVDGGVTTVRSPQISIPNSATTPLLKFNYYLAHRNNSSTDDYLAVAIVGSTTEFVFADLGAPTERAASWRSYAVPLANFVGQTVQIEIYAADAGTASLVEAAIDDLSIVDTAIPAGVTYDYFQGSWNSLPNFDAVAPLSSGSVATFDITPRQQDNQFGFRFNSCLAVKLGGTYTFHTTSDDGSKLFINGSEVVDNDGLHSSQTRSGAISLPAGLHSIRVEMFENSGSQVLTVEYEGPTITRQEIPADMLWRAECDLRPLGSGIAALDSATGSGYIMYTAESVFDRFTSPAPNGANAEHFIAVRYHNGNWQWDNNGGYTNFTPRSSDVLLAAVDFTADTVTMLEGVNQEVGGMRSGYQDGDINFIANWWHGSSNNGEFGVEGSYFVRYTSAPSQPPTVTAPSNQTNENGDNISLQINATDPDGDALTYTADGLPAGLSINPNSGLISGIATTAGTHTVTVTVDDGFGGIDSASFNWVVNVIDGWIYCAEEDDTCSFSGIKQVRYGINGSYDTGAFTDGVACTNTNFSDPAVGQQKKCWYRDLPQLPPEVTNPGASYALFGESTTIQIEASDPNGDTLTYSETGLPNGWSINTNTGEISGTLTEANAGPHSVTVTVNDGTSDVAVLFTLTGIPRQSEAGSVTVNQTNAGQWRTITLAHAYKNPVVVMGAPSANDSEALTVRVRHVTSTSFEFQLDEWDYLDGAHGTETVGYLVVESGILTLNNGQRLMAGVANGVDTTFGTVTFPASFPSAPIVLAQVASVNENTAVTERLRNVDINQFQLRLQEEEAADGVHVDETVHWIALVPTVESGNFEAANTGAIVDEVAEPIAFAQTYSARPIFLGRAQTTFGIDTAALRYQNLTPSGVELFYQEEQSLNDEVVHSDEEIGYLIIEPANATNPFGQTLNNAPVVTEPGNQSNTVGDSVSLQIVATDSDNDTLAYEAFGLPAGLMINADSGLISGTPTTVTNYAVVITVSDDNGGEDSVSFTWNITSVPNTLPEIVNPGDQTTTVNTAVNLTIGASDADGDSLEFSANNLPTGLMIDESSGVISGTPTAVNTYAVEVTVTDEKGGSDSAVFAWTINAVPNSDPELSNPGNQTTIVGDSVSLSLSATDAENDTLLFGANNLPTGLSINANSGVISGTPTEIDVYAVEVTVNDGKGGSDSAVFSWTVTDAPNSDPTIDNPGVQRTNLNTAVSLQINAADEDGDDLTFVANNLPTGLSINANTGRISGTVTEIDVYAVEIIVNDGRGGSASAVFGWVVEDLPNRPPEVSDPGDQTSIVGQSVSLTLEATDLDGDSLTYEAENLPLGLTLNANTGVISGTPTEVNAYAVIITADDGNGGTDTAVFAWAIIAQPNSIPTITDPGDQTNFIGDTVNLAIDASDGDGDALFFTANNLPTGLTINPASGAISGTTAQAGAYAVLVTADDGNGGVANTVFVWNVIAVPNAPPVIGPPSDQTNVLNDTVNVDIDATDADGDTLTYSAINLPPGLSINPNSGLISGNVTQAGRYAILILVEDGNGGSANAVFNWVINDASSSNETPVLNNPGNQATVIDTAVSLTLAATDADADTLTFGATNLPTGLSINANSGVISGTATEADSYATVVTVSDGNGGVASAVFIWIVNEVPNNPPIVIDPDDQSHLLNDAVSLQISASDPDEDVLGFTAVNLPPGLTLNSETGGISGTLTQAGQYAVIVTVSDSRGGSHNASFFWAVNSVLNVGPIVIDPGDQTNIINDAINLSIQANDANGDSLTFTVLNLPDGLALNDATGQISGNLTQIGLFPVVVTVSDGQGGSASTSFIWDVTGVPNNIPVLQTPPTQENAVGDTVSLQLFASDLDNDTLRFAISSLPAGVSINPNTGRIAGTITSPGNYLVTASVTDGIDTAEVDFLWIVDEPADPLGIERIYLPLLAFNYRPDEPNDICLDAFPLNLNQEYAFNHEDFEDWYVFELTDLERVFIDMDNFTADGQIVVYGGTCSNLNFMQNNGNFDAVKNLDLGIIPAGKYYLRVITDNNYNDPTPYNLRVRIP